MGPAKMRPRKASAYLLGAILVLATGVASAVEPVFSTASEGAIRGLRPRGLFHRGRAGQGKARAAT